MLTGLLTSDIALNIVLPVLAVAGVAFGIYVKGRGDGARVIEEKVQKEKDKVEKEIKKAQKKVVSLEQTRRAKKAEIEEASKSIKALVELWNSTFGKKPK